MKPCDKQSFPTKIGLCMSLVKATMTSALTANYFRGSKNEFELSCGEVKPSEVDIATSCASSELKYLT